MTNPYFILVINSYNIKITFCINGKFKRKPYKAKV